VILRWRNPDNGRRYEAAVGEDLFGDPFLWRGWCGANGKRGGQKEDVFTWEVDCLRALRRVIRRRKRRGYVLLDDLLPCSERGRVGGGCRPHVQGEPAAAQEAPETNAGMEKALPQITPGDGLGELT
jgi:hypothetical protein